MSTRTACRHATAGSRQLCMEIKLLLYCHNVTILLSLCHHSAAIVLPLCYHDATTVLHLATNILYGVTSVLPLYHKHAAINARPIYH